MTHNDTIAETKQKLEQAEKANLDTAVDLYRDQLEELKAEDGADADAADESEDTEAALSHDDPTETALYAALTGKSYSGSSSVGAALAENEQEAAVLQERLELAEERGLDAAAEHYRRQQAALGVDTEEEDVNDIPDAETALAAADAPDADGRDKRAAELAEKELAAEESGLDGAVRHYRQRRRDLQ